LPHTGHRKGCPTGTWIIAPDAPSVQNISLEHRPGNVITIGGLG
jgi:hypothetical protein